MATSVVLRGYRFSVYHRIAQVVLREKGVAYETQEVDPFAPDIPGDYLKRHPFGRVPVLSHGDFDIYETAAISRYVNAAFDGPDLLPSGAVAAGRAAQVISIIDNYGYHPLIRQVFSHRVFRPAAGEPADESEISAGMEASRRVLGALNGIAGEGNVLDGHSFSIADCHLAPMIAYFVQAPEGAHAFREYPELAAWWGRIAHRPSITATDPSLPGLE